MADAVYEQAVAPKHQIDELKVKAQKDPKQDGSAEVIVQDTK